MNLNQELRKAGKMMRNLKVAATGLLCLWCVMTGRAATTSGIGAFGSNGNAVFPGAVATGARLDLPIYVGTIANGGTLGVDSLRGLLVGTNSGATFTVTLATNTTVYSGTNNYIRVQMYNSSGSTATWSYSGFGTVTPVGNVGTNVTGMNTIEFWTIGTQWYVYQDTGKISLLQIAGTPELDVASASTVDLGALATRNARITGTTTITSFGTAGAGLMVWGRFAGALTLTHNATSLILPTSANITTAANDRFSALSLGSGNWLVLFYQRADGSALISSGSSFPAQATPTIAVQAAAGSTATATFTGPTQKDGRFQVTLTPGGTGITSGAQFIVTFGSAYSATPVPLVSPADDDAAAAFGYSKAVWVTASTTTLTLNVMTGVSLASGASYVFNFVVVP